ncbi:MAG: hypothetical protein DWQ37_21420 [Planctomycetota bacterium]|nr:MAG: hypothetical protein DWQ37_21420 [Planctomycetota bacterium]
MNIPGRRKHGWPRHFVLALVAGALAGFGAARAGEPSGVDTAVARQVDALIEALDDPNFATRYEAAGRLEQFAGRGELAQYLAQRFRRALVSDDASFEVRSRLESLLRELPAPAAAAAEKPTTDQIKPLLDQLGSDSYAKRDSAVRSLRAMLEHTELIVPVWLALKSRAANPALTPSGRRILEPLLDDAHEAWLRADPEKVPLPKPAEKEITRLIDELGKSQNAQSIEQYERSQAERELLDLIARDDTRQQVVDQLNERIAADPESNTAAQMQYLVDFAEPAMVAESWSNRQHNILQYLIIGVPQFNDTLTTPRATHFDRIDDRTAHCVTGNSLTEGDYPVRVAIPHPEPGRDTFFYLTNLPTPRSRLAYEYSVERDERLRLAEITKRTLDYLLERRTPLSEVEVLMLASLEPRAVSRFVGDYFDTVPNAPLHATPGGLNTQQTVYSGICAVLSRVGTHEAIPALEKLARSGALGKPRYPNRVEIAWVAALAIAQRDPGPDVDQWLASLLDEDAALTTDPDLPPTLGASAAGLLLDRHGKSVRSFGLTTAAESVTEVYHFIGYRFTSADDRQKVKKWWAKQHQLAAAAKPKAAEETRPALVPHLPAKPRQARAEPGGK